MNLVKPSSALRTGQITNILLTPSSPFWASFPVPLEDEEVHHRHLVVPGDLGVPVPQRLGQMIEVAEAQGPDVLLRNVGEPADIPPHHHRQKILPVLESGGRNRPQRKSWGHYQRASFSPSLCFGDLSISGKVENSRQEGVKIKKLTGNGAVGSAHA